MWNLLVFDGWARRPVVKTRKGNYMVVEGVNKPKPSRLTDVDLLIAMRGMKKVYGVKFNQLEVIPV